MKIKYEVDKEGMIKTYCPYFYHKVGGLRCSQCDWFIYDDEVDREVDCRMNKLGELRELESKWTKGEITHVKSFDWIDRFKIISFVFDDKFSGVNTEYGFLEMWHIDFEWEGK